MNQALATADDHASQHHDHAALTELVRYLSARGYLFVTPTPATHARVLANAGDRLGSDDRDVFGWSMAFGPDLLPPGLLATLHAAGIVEERPGGFGSRVRVSSLNRHLLVHSAFPTDDKDAVFFGPDSYRFAALIRRELARCPDRAGARLVDIGTGAGVGAIVADDLCPGADIHVTDVNPRALSLAAFNAGIAGTRIRGHLSGDLSPLSGCFDIVLANPPYIMDKPGRAYRDGGDMHGAGLSLKMATEAVERLAPGGRLILYTGSAILKGGDPLRDSLHALAARVGCTLRYEEIDPDVFGEEIETEAYRDVERIALVSAVIERAPSAERDGRAA